MSIQFSNNTFTEVLYIVPHIVYKTDSIEFVVSIVLKAFLTTSGVSKLYSKTDGTADLMVDASVTSVFNTAFTIKIEDAKFGGLMKYNPNVLATITSADKIALTTTMKFTTNDSVFKSQTIFTATQYTTANAETTCYAANSITEDATTGFINCMVSQMSSNDDIKLSLMDFIQQLANTLGSYLL